MVLPAACLETPRRRPTSAAVAPKVPMACIANPCAGRRSGCPRDGELLVRLVDHRAEPGEQQQRQLVPQAVTGGSVSVARVLA